MTSRNAKRQSKKSETATEKRASNPKTRQIEQFYGIGDKRTKCEGTSRTSKSPTATKRSRSSTSSTATRLIKLMKQNKEALSVSTEFLKDENECEMKTIPETLDGDLLNIGTDGERQQRTNGTEGGHELDQLLHSEAAKRIRLDNEVTIRFCCPLLANVGTLDHVFCIDDLSQLKRLLAGASAQISPVPLLFLSRPHSRLRCALFERFRRKADAAAGGALAVPYSTFVLAVCYAFQVSPVSLHFTDEKEDDAFEQQSNEFDLHFASAKVENQRRSQHTRFANIELLFRLWPLLRFDHWTDAQIVALCRALARLYLDANARAFRCQISRAFQMIFHHFPSSTRLSSVLSNFVVFSLLPSADQCVHRAFLVLQMLSQTDKFDRTLRLLATQSVLRATIAKNCAPHGTTAQPLLSSHSSASTPINLGDALDGLPEAVLAVRHQCSAEDELTGSQTSSSSLTVLYLLCNRWLDILTADERLLTARGESEASLEKAMQSIREANGHMNRRNINDKMIYTWAQSEHRIRAALLRLQRGHLRMSNQTAGISKGKDNRNSRKLAFVGSSSEEDDDDDDNGGELRGRKECPTEE